MTKKKAFFIIGITAILIALLLSACGLLKPLMSDKEIEERLREVYGEEFVVVSSKSFPTDDAFRAKVYVVSPKDEPDFTFYAYSFIEGETGGVLGVRRSLIDTYIEKKIQAQFDKYAKEESLEYTVEYSVNLSKKVVSTDSSSYYTDIVNIFKVTPETLYNVSRKLSLVLNKILEDEQFSEEIYTTCGLQFHYFVNGKETRTCFTALFAYGWDSVKETNRPVDISEEGIRKMIVG